MVHRNEYRKRLTAISNYMQKFRVPGMVQERVKLWLQYTWEHQKIFQHPQKIQIKTPESQLFLLDCF